MTPTFLHSLAEVLSPVKYGMEDDASFHAKIRENPEEKTPALVYADYLEEQGKPTMAEHIRQNAKQYGDGGLLGAGVSPNREPGSFAVRASPEGADSWTGKDATHYGVRLNQRMADNPDWTLAWNRPSLSPEEAKQVVRRLVAEGGKVEGEPARRLSLEGDLHAALNDNEAALQNEQPTHQLAAFMERMGRPATADVLRRAKTVKEINYFGPHETTYQHSTEGRPVAHLTPDGNIRLHVKSLVPTVGQGGYGLGHKVFVWETPAVGDPVEELTRLHQEGAEVHPDNKDGAEDFPRHQDRYRLIEMVLRYGMEDHQSFQNKILENIAEEVPHLVYADWLDEQGKPVHAAFIRRAVEGMRDRAGRIGRGEWSGSIFHTYSEPHADADFATHGYLGGLMGSTIDLSSQLPNEQGNRMVWSVGGLSPEEGRQLRDALASEGAAAGPISNDPEDPLNQKQNHSVIEEALKYSLAEHSDFHKALAQEPNEKTHALVYADFLDEQGMHEHANFIRQHTKTYGLGAQRYLYQQSELPDQKVGEFHTEHNHFDGKPRLMLSTLVPTDQTNPISGEPLLHRLQWWQRYPSEQARDESFEKLKAEGAHTSPPPVPQLGDIQEVNEQFKTVEKPVRYSSVPEHDVHPDYAPTGIAPRLGHALNEIAGTDSDAGLLAEGILRTGDNSLLKILADKLDDDDHPLKDAFDWRHAERGIKIDNAVHKFVQGTGSQYVDPHFGTMGFPPYTPARILTNWINRRRPGVSRKRMLSAVQKSVPDATKDDLHHSLLRLSDNMMQSLDGATPAVAPDGAHQAIFNARLKQLGTQTENPHTYPDTRPPNKRLYALKVKYALAEATDFHNAISQDPTENTHHLVYADWLDENGRPQQAAFIRQAIQHRLDADHLKGGHYQSCVSDCLEEVPPLSVLHLKTGSHTHSVIVHEQMPHPTKGTVAHAWALRLLPKQQALETVKSLLEEGLQPFDKETTRFVDSPTKYRKSKEWIRQKIKKLMGEGKPQKQAVAISLQMAGVPTKYGLEDENAFHQKMVSERHESTPALVYADWLQEQGKEAQTELVRSHVKQSGRGPLVRTWQHFEVARNDRGNNGLPPNVAVTISYPHNGKRFVTLMHKVDDRHHLQFDSESLPEGEAQSLVQRIRDELTPPEKYAAWKAPKNGMIVKESPLAVAGTFVEGGSFTPDLSKMAAPVPAPEPVKKITLSSLLKRLRQKR